MSNSQVHTSKSINQSVANQVKEKVINEKEISDVKAVNTNKELLLAVKVDLFDPDFKETGLNSDNTLYYSQKLDGLITIYQRLKIDNIQKVDQKSCIAI